MIEINPFRIQVRKVLSTILLITMVVGFNGILSANVQAQITNELSLEQDIPTPRGAFLRSLVVPGWGHLYADSQDWTRGKYHLATDVTLVLSYFGAKNRASMFSSNLNTLAQSKAGNTLVGKNRDYELALANFDNIDEYNDFQLRSRNWERVYTKNVGFDWSWESSEDRFAFQRTRERVSSAENQLPGLLTLMVANRLLSGINAYTKARNRSESIPQASLSYINEFGEPGITAHIRVNF